MKASGVLRSSLVLVTAVITVTLLIPSLRIYAAAPSASQDCQGGTAPGFTLSDCEAWWQRGAATSSASQEKQVLGECKRFKGRAYDACYVAVQYGASDGSRRGGQTGSGQSSGGQSSQPSADANCNQCLPSTNIPIVGVDSAVNDGVTIVSFLAGILSAIFIVIGGIRYTTSEGNPQNLSSAKQTLTYAIAGLAISIIAKLIVGFVIASGPH